MKTVVETKILNDADLKTYFFAQVATIGSPGRLGRRCDAGSIRHEQPAAAHAFQDYRATISATNMGKSGVMVREQYLSVLP